MAKKQFLDAEGVKYLWSKVNMQDYPNNEMLIAILNAIDDTKADKTELNDYLLIKDYVAGETGGEIILDNFITKNEAASIYAPKNILEVAYPVGAIYLSINSTNPSSLFGFGTWERIEDRFLLGASSTYVAGTTGGETSHILTVDEMPSHSHTFLRHQFDRNDGDNGTDVYGANNKTLPQVNATTDAAGGGQAHNNMPPYLVVYMWKRVS